MKTAPAASPAEPAHAVTDKVSGSRWYIHPRTGERFISVTTVLSCINRPGLPDWAGGLAARAAFDRLPWLIRSSRNPDCNATKTEDACGQCRPCAELWLANRHNDVRDEASSLGTRLHDAAEQISLFGEGAEVDDEVRPFVNRYLEWRERYKPTYLAAEMTVISRKWGYAGTLDKIVQFSEASRLPAKLAHLVDLPVCGDYKTSKSVDIPKGWQVVAYAAADAVLLPDGSEEPMPEIKGGLIVHIRPDKVQTREVHLSDANHARFVHALRVAEGLGDGLGSVLSRPVNLKDS